MKDNITLIQLSDLHLSGNIGTDESYRHFLHCLQNSKQYAPDYYLFTGDLANHGDKEATDWLFDTMHAQKIPFFAIAGNHDASEENNCSLTFESSNFMAKTPDHRLLNCVNIDLGAWQLLLIDSTVAGHIHGKIHPPALVWLQQQLSTKHKPSILAFHHHPLAVKSAWIDNHMLQNAQQLWQLLAPYSHAKLILCGHVHQTHRLQKNHTTIHTAPSTYQQFTPFAQDFHLDDTGNGFVRLLLTKDSFQIFVHKVASC